MDIEVAGKRIILQQEVPIPCQIVKYFVVIATKVQELMGDKISMKKDK
jgi:hypothetical protein